MPKPLDRTKLIRFMNVAASTAHDGEAMNALRHACRMVREAEITWDDLLTEKAAAPPPQSPKNRRDFPCTLGDPPSVWYGYIMSSDYQASPKEWTFLMTISAQNRLHRLSDRQTEWLASIAVKAGVISP